MQKRNDTRVQAPLSTAIVSSRQECSFHAHGYRSMWLNGQSISHKSKMIPQITKQCDLVSEISRCRKSRQLHKYKALLNRAFCAGRSSRK